jgi:hypothetical protein
MERRGMTESERRYMEGWGFYVRMSKDQANDPAKANLAFGQVSLAVSCAARYPRGNYLQDPFTPHGAGMADAALVTLDLDA